MNNEIETVEVDEIDWSDTSNKIVLLANDLEGARLQLALTRPYVIRE